MNVLVNGLSAPSGPIATALANHLWQSTLFAAVAAALTLLLRKNSARVRYWLWLIASLKFLLPFSLLVAAGTQLHWSEPRATGQASFSFLMEEISRPFSPAAALHAPVNAHSDPYSWAARVLPVCLLIVWFAACVAILLFWYLRWRRMASAIREAAPITSGRELEALRQLERMAGITRPTGLVVSKSSLEPGIIGIFRPVMFLPAGIPDRLTDSQLQAIITHELCHVRRRDNLAAALHMLVEALFWFHPFVWWIGARLVDERERACDEEVLRFGSEPQVYAEGILRVCEFYLETPLVCAAGVTGSNLKKRIEEIMIHRIARKLEIGKKLLLGLVAAAAFIGPVALGILHPAPSQAQSKVQSSTPGAAQIESASIMPSQTATDQTGAGNAGKGVISSRMMFRPESFKAENVTLHQLIRAAFGVQKTQIQGGPDWGSTRLYDADVKFTNDGSDHIQRVTEQRLALQALLADRFKLQTHRELKPLAVYELAVGLNGPKLTEVHTSGEAIKRGLSQQSPGHFTGTSVKISTLIAALEWQLGTPIIDKTGLKGNYDFTLTIDWPQTRPVPDDPAPLLKAVSEQLGLELKPATDTVEVLVIDHAEAAANDKKDLAQAK
jgi:bla regulator protein blaR1